MTALRSILVVQTAFAGDLVLTLPLIQLIHERYPETAITVLTVPAAGELLANHPAVTRVIVYDKRGAQKGPAGLLRMAALLRLSAFDAAVIPHRSLRSALVCRLARIPVRIGFDISAGSFLLTHREPYVVTDSEPMRDLALAVPLGIPSPRPRYPRLYPSDADRLSVDAFIRSSFGRDAVLHTPPCIAVAPGSVWNTKRWPERRFSELVRSLLTEGWNVVLVGGAADRDLCARVRGPERDQRVADASGRFSLLESAELIGRCQALVSNDSAPVHLAVAMRVPVVAIFGPTLPSFGFAPTGPRDRVVETAGLRCRPCSVHGSARCPTGTFDCMGQISSVRVTNEVLSLAGHRGDN
ncbi:MAG TPA: lipopolysaccharide heptosyltransferase II [Bacteroidota bacterium]|nr:lipopolysaccharide heptosyltransferase II [Bacteroidota bacterium]